MPQSKDSSPGDVVRLVQITDCHLSAVPHTRQRGVDPDASLEAVLAAIAADAPDALVASGDLADDASVEAYARLREHLSGLGIPCAVLPGNHDDRATMAATLVGGDIVMPKQWHLGHWRLLAVDSAIPGEPQGRVGDEQLAYLTDALAGDTTPALVMVHHQPLAVGSAWIDEMALEDGASLLALAERFAHVRAIAWGHVHHRWESDWHGARLLATPSTCYQALPSQTHFAHDRTPPGFRRFSLYANGGLGSDVVRVPEAAV